MKKLTAISVILIFSVIFISFPTAAYAVEYEPGIYIVTEPKGVNVRSGPSKEYDKIDTLGPDNIFTAYDVNEEGWGKTEVNGREGWVYLTNAVRFETSVSLSEDSYYIFSAVGEDMAVSCRGENSVSQSMITRVKSSDNKLQQFTLTHLENGYYKIVSDAGYALFATDDNRAMLFPLDYEDKPEAFLWTIIYSGGGKYRIKSASGLYLDVEKASNEEGALVQLFRLKNSIGQLYSIVGADEFVPRQSFAENNDGTLIEYSVPLYKQSDKRWSKIKIGTKNIGSVGCLVTSLAMKESYHSEEIIYPNAMRNMLSFDNNDLLWSSIDQLGFTYKTIYSESTPAILAEIYSKLKTGPVVIGCKNVWGRSHWVCITGYSDPNVDINKLDSAKFTINDPGGSRRSFAELLKTHPKIIGYVW